MKKKLLLLGIAFLTSLAPLAARADELVDMAKKMYPHDNVQAINRPKSSLVIDGSTCDVVWEDNVDEVRDPASMSKLMTLYLVFEAIKEGKISEKTVITATPQDQATANIYEISNNKIVAGVDYTVSELITMTIVPSSNATTVMLANYLSDNDPDAFLDRMNAKAQELGMTNTKWFNASGAAAVSFKGYYNPQNYDNYASNQTTARDLAILAYNFVNHHPEILNYTNKAKVTVKAGTPYEETFETYNYSLPGAKYALKGVDGMKTGSSPNGAFNYIATIKRGDQRMIAVIMGVGDWSDQDGEYYRHPFGNALIEKAYADYEYKKLLSKGEQEIDGQKYKLPEDFYATVKKGTKPKVKVENNVLKAENGLKTLSSKISDEMKVEKVENPVAQAIENVTGSKSESKPWYGVFFSDKMLILLPVGILLIILYFEYHSRQKRKAAKQERRRNTDVE